MAVMNDDGVAPMEVQGIDSDVGAGLGEPALEAVVAEDVAWVQGLVAVVVAVPLAMLEIAVVEMGRHAVLDVVFGTAQLLDLVPHEALQQEMTAPRHRQDCERPHQVDSCPSMQVLQCS